MLPADGHIHSQWSWDALSGSMERSCARAAALGLRSIAFTEHIDFTMWTIPPEAVAAMPAEFRTMIRPDGRFCPPPFDLAGYAESIERCRSRFGELRISSGAELGEPHWHPAEVKSLLSGYDFDRAIGSVHSLADADVYLVVDRAFSTYPAAEVVRRYLVEVLCLVQSSNVFAVLGHLDYPLRAWPTSAGPVALDKFEEEFRAVLTALAASGRALEVNTRLPASPILLRWWRDSGGRALSFGSDAHDPAQVACDFATAAAVAEASGFRAASGEDFWIRG
jgi:histidinol-phosphatase (PHP family)